MDLSDKKALFVIPPFDFRDEELFETKELLEAADIQINIASSVKGICRGMLGGTIESKYQIISVATIEHDAVIFIGGDGSMTFWEDSIAHKIIIDAYNMQKIVAAIGSAPVTLANSGILAGKRVTCWKNEQVKVESRGALYTSELVTYDGKIITASTPECAAQFARSIIKGLMTI